MTNLVYFSNVSNNTTRFVDKLGMPALKIPVKAKDEPLLVVEPYVLILPTYGGGHIKGSVPVQVKKFLNNEDNRKHIRGVIAAGNINFGEAFCTAGQVIKDKLHVPFLYRFELMGTPYDVEMVENGLNEFWIKEQQKIYDPQSLVNQPT